MYHVTASPLANPLVRAKHTLLNLTDCKNQGAKLLRQFGQLSSQP